MEITNNVNVAVDRCCYDLFQSDEEHPRNLFEINVRRMLQTCLRDPQATPQLVKQFPINVRIAIPEERLSLPSSFDSFFRNVFIWICTSVRYDLESSRIDTLASELANYTRNTVIPHLHSSDATCFLLIAELTAISNYNHKEEMLPADDTEEEEEEEEEYDDDDDETEEEEMERESGVPDFVLERLRKSSFPYKEKGRGGSLPMTKIDVGDECGVCLQEYCTVKNASKLITCLPCGHVFHQECIFRWFEGQNSCPCCRGRVE